MARGYQDFAGCGVVHIVGGMSAFFASWFLGPRFGFEFDPKDKPNVFTDPSYAEMEKNFPGKEKEFKAWVTKKLNKPFKISSVMDVTAGTLILWLGWFYFNGASASTMYAPRANSVSRIYMNTLVAAGAAAVTHTYLKPLCFR